jgi:hypothetical protein
VRSTTSSSALVGGEERLAHTGGDRTRHEKQVCVSRRRDDAEPEPMPEPRLVAALGDCALGCHLLGTPEALVGPVDTVLPSICVSRGARRHPKRSPLEEPAST